MAKAVLTVNIVFSIVFSQGDKISVDDIFNERLALELSLFPVQVFV